MEKKSIRQKINALFLIISLITIVGLSLLLTVGFYETLQNTVFDQLEAYAKDLKSIGVFEDASKLPMNIGDDRIRITVVKKDGRVLFDNAVKISDMSNHSSRPEVEEAFSNGEGKVIRKSATLNKSTFYYAIKLQNDSVLRVAQESENIWSVIFRLLPLLLIASALVLLISFISSSHLTKTIVDPIEEMANNMDLVESTGKYKEIQPIIETIRKQHLDIIKSAKARQEFTANVSHELKTPLTAISGYAELIESGIASEEDTARFSKEIRKNSERLINLINDIIHLSELDSEAFQPETSEVDLYELTKEMAHMLELSAEKYQVRVSVWGEHGVVVTNRNMMEELVYNLIDNAIRYNKPSGTVDVEVRNLAKFVKVIVRDTGIGIGIEDQERIFERFYRVDKSHSKETGGTGLGLAIVKHVMELSGATMEIDSTVGKGTSMKVTVPKNSFAKNNVSNSKG